MRREAGGPRHAGAAWVIVVAFGLLTFGTGVYFMALRPALLPEDLRFTGLRQGEVAVALAGWLRIVFRTWGAFIVGIGLVILGNGASHLANRPGLSRAGMAGGCVLAFGSLLLSNIQIGSDFLWFIALLFAGAVASALIVLRAK